MKNRYLTFLLILTGIPFIGPLQAQDTLSIDLTGMTPHVDQDLTLFLRDSISGDYLDTIIISPIETANFTVDFPIHAGDFFLDFFADHNNNGMFDPPPADHAWRLILNNIGGDTTITWAHNTVFTNIFEGNTSGLYDLTVNFTGMTPHTGQDLSLYVRNAENGDILDSLVISPINNAAFTVVFDSITGDTDINFDFFADLNANGMYDTPPADHAWRIELGMVMGDTTLEFAHNTTFTDIFADTYTLTVDFVSMDPHNNQNLILYLREPESGEIIDSFKVSPINAATFEVVFDSIGINTDYNLDFYADLNGNGQYDIPPADHAWRIELRDIQSDTTMEFVHNTTFTDIGLGVPTGVYTIEDLGFSSYPNPVQDELTVNLIRSGVALSIYNVAGALLLQRQLTSDDKQVRLDVSALKPGIYVLRFNSDTGTTQQKFLKE